LSLRQVALTVHCNVVCAGLNTEPNEMQSWYCFDGFPPWMWDS